MATTVRSSEDKTNPPPPPGYDDPPPPYSDRPSGSRPGLAVSAISTHNARQAPKPEPNPGSSANTEGYTLMIQFTQRRPPNLVHRTTGQQVDRGRPSKRTVSDVILLPPLPFNSRGRKGRNIADYPFVSILTAIQSRASERLPWSNPAAPTTCGRLIFHPRDFEAERGKAAAVETVVDEGNWARVGSWVSVKRGDLEYEVVDVPAMWSAVGVSVPLAGLVRTGGLGEERGDVVAGTAGEGKARESRIVEAREGNEKEDESIGKRSQKGLGEEKVSEWLAECGKQEISSTGRSCVTM